MSEDTAAPQPSPEVIEAIKADAKQPGPAHEIRQAQALIAGGLFPGQMAPAITSAFMYLDRMAAKIEADAKAAEPTFTEQVKAKIAESNLEVK